MTIRMQLRQRLQESTEAVLAVVSHTDAAATTAQANPGWSAHDLLAHLASAELGHAQVIRQLVAGQPTLIPGFDLDAFNDAEVTARRTYTWEALVAEYRANRAATLALLDEITDGDWEKAGPHPGGFDTTVAGVFRVITIHERRHLRELKTALEIQ